jgi:hypothetical protein
MWTLPDSVTACVPAMGNDDSAGSWAIDLAEILALSPLPDRSHSPRTDSRRQVEYFNRCVGVALMDAGLRAALLSAVLGAVSRKALRYTGAAAGSKTLLLPLAFAASPWLLLATPLGREVTTIECQLCVLGSDSREGERMRRIMRRVAKTEEEERLARHAEEMAHTSTTRTYEAWRRRGHDLRCLIPSRSSAEETALLGRPYQHSPIVVPHAPPPPRLVVPPPHVWDGESGLGPADRGAPLVQRPEEEEGEKEETEEERAERMGDAHLPAHRLR